MKLKLPRLWYFTLTKKVGAETVTMYLTLFDGKFRVRHYLYDDYCLNMFQALYYNVLFNLPPWLYKNGNLFGYDYVEGSVKLNKLEKTTNKKAAG